MHPDNPYRRPIDFKSLASTNEEVRAYCRLGTNGKIHFDFSCDAAVRALTNAILHTDFQLTVHLPEGTLCPRVPQRLDYLLWLRDWMRNEEVEKEGKRRGIDIGTGASAIYALLGARRLEWRFVATEINEETCEVAKRNTRENGLDQLIQVRRVKEGNALLKEVVLDSKELFDFCMCNPPFFGDEETKERFDPTAVGWMNRCGNGMDEGGKGGGRAPPRSSTTATQGELTTTGGEVAFVQQLIEESRELKERVRLYSTMLGRKSSVAILRRTLAGLEEEEKKDNGRKGCIRHWVHEMEHGKTKRWILAWTFDEGIRKPHNSAVFRLELSTVEGGTMQWIRKELTELGISSQEGEEGVYEARRRSWLRKARKRKLSEEGIADLATKLIFRVSLDQATSSRDHGGYGIVFTLIEGDKADLNHLVQYLSNRVGK